MNEKHLNYVKSNSLELLDNELFSDFEIKIKEDVYRCHKCVLYCGSGFFKGFLNFNPDAFEINLSEEIITAVGIKNCLLYLYKLGCDPFVSDEHCEETYVAADYLQISLLKSVASEKISGNINVHNAFGIVRFSVIYNDKPLRMKAQNFINNNFNKLCFENKDFLSLQFDTVSEIVSDKKLSSTDFLILKALLKWTTFDLASRKQILQGNVKNIVQTHLISSDQWNQLSQQSDCYDIVMHIKQMFTELNYYSDKPHRIGTPIVLHCIGSHRQGRLECSSNYFYVDKSIDQLRPMREDRFNHRICSSSTFVFVIGGENCDGCIFKSCERYNLVEKVWEGMAELDCNRSSFAVACLEGFVYLIGGHTVGDNEASCQVSKDILIYDSGNDSWLKSEFKTPCDMIDAVAVGHASLIYVAGGLNGNDRPANKIMEFDPASGDWTKINTAGLPEDLFNVHNIGTIHLAAGGWSQEDEGFLLICGKLNDCYMLYVYHFSLNRWRLSSRLQDLYNSMSPANNRVTIYCQREFISILSLVSVSMLEQLAQPIPQTDSIDDQLLLYLKFQITNDWTGEIDLTNHCLLKSFSARPGYQFLLAALVLD